MRMHVRSAVRGVAPAPSNIHTVRSFLCMILWWSCILVRAIDMIDVCAVALYKCTQHNARLNLMVQRTLIYRI